MGKPAMDNLYITFAVLFGLVSSGYALTLFDVSNDVEDISSSSDDFNLLISFVTDPANSDESKSIVHFNHWFAVVSIGLCIIGVIGNVIVVFILLVLRDYKKKTTDLVVLQLAFADLLYLTELPFKAITVLQNNDEWIFSQPLCQFHTVINQFSSYVSIMLIVLMSVDRYIAICHPFTSSRKLTIKFVAWSSMIIWISCLLLSIPSMTIVSMNVKCQCSLKGKDTLYLGNNTLESNGRPAHCNMDITGLPELSGPHPTFPSIEGFDMNNTIAEIDFGEYEGFEEYSAFENTSDTDLRNDGLECNYFDASTTVRAIYYFDCIAMYFVPAMVLVVTYSFILREVISSRRQVQQFGINCSGNQQISLAQRTTYTCTAIVTCFIIFWLPDNVYVISRFSGLPLTSIDCRSARYICNLVGYISPVLNPFFYTFIKINFRKRLSSASEKFTSTVRRKVTKNSNNDINKPQAKHKNDCVNTRYALNTVQAQTLSTNLSNNNNNNDVFKIRYNSQR